VARMSRPSQDDSPTGETRRVWVPANTAGAEMARKGMQMTRARPPPQKPPADGCSSPLKSAVNHRFIGNDQNIGETTEARPAQLVAGQKSNDGPSRHKIRSALAGRRA